MNPAHRRQVVNASGPLRRNDDDDVDVGTEGQLAPSLPHHGPRVAGPPASGHPLAYRETTPVSRRRTITRGGTRAAGMAGSSLASRFGSSVDVDERNRARRDRASKAHARHAARDGTGWASANGGLGPEQRKCADCLEPGGSAPGPAIVLRRTSRSDHARKSSFPRRPPFTGTASSSTATTTVFTGSAALASSSRR